MDSDIVSAALRRVYLVAVAGLAYAAFGRVRDYWRLRHFKGPWSTGWSWVWHSRAVLSGAAHQWYGDATEKYGEGAPFPGCFL